MSVADPGSTPLEQVETRELALTLVTAVEFLPLAQRETFVLFTDAGLTLEEVAHATNVGVETAKSRLRYARCVETGDLWWEAGSWLIRTLRPTRWTKPTSGLRRS